MVYCSHVTIFEIYRGRHIGMALVLGIAVHSYKRLTFHSQTKGVNETDSAQPRLAKAKKL